MYTHRKGGEADGGRRIGVENGEEGGGGGWIIS